MFAATTPNTEPININAICGMLHSHSRSLLDPLYLRSHNSSGRNIIRNKIGFEENTFLNVLPARTSLQIIAGAL